MIEWVDDAATAATCMGAFFGRISNKISNSHYCNWIDTFIFEEVYVANVFNSIRNKKNIYDSVVRVLFSALSSLLLCIKREQKSTLNFFFFIPKKSLYSTYFIFSTHILFIKFRMENAKKNRFTKWINAYHFYSTNKK